jgi:hypothetical protein
MRLSERNPEGIADVLGELLVTASCKDLERCVHVSSSSAPGKSW